MEARGVIVAIIPPGGQLKPDPDAVMAAGVAKLLPDDVRDFPSLADWLTSVFTLPAGSIFSILGKLLSDLPHLWLLFEGQFPDGHLYIRVILPSDASLPLTSLHNFSQQQLKLYGKGVAGAVIANDVLRVPSGFFGEKSIPLWMHPNYLLLEDYINRILQAGDTTNTPAKNHFHVVATPGIGKSYFGHYWFFKQAKAKLKVIWRTKGDDPEFLFYDFSLADPFVTSSHHYSPLPAAEWSQAWLIVDGASKGVPHRGPLLHCVSPGRGGYHEFSKDKGLIVHLEAWSLEDLKNCSDAVGLGLSDTELEARFDICGGIPREVFDTYKSCDDLKNLMATALAGAPSREAVIGHAVGDDPSISDYLLHYRLATDLDLNVPSSHRVRQNTHKLIFASDYIAETVYHRYQAQGFDHAKRFFDFCQEIPVAQSLAGKFFEKNFHNQLKEKGGVYKIKALQQHQSQVSLPTLEIKPKLVRRLRRWEITKQETEPSGRKRKRVEKTGFTIFAAAVSKDVSRTPGSQEAEGLAALPSGCFVEPYSAIQKSFDSLLTPDTIFQVTVALEHKICWSGIEEVIREYDQWHDSHGLARPASYKLIFIVPESKFHGYRFQAYKKDDGEVYKVVLPDMSRIVQFAVAFPWEER